MDQSECLDSTDTGIDQVLQKNIFLEQLPAGKHESFKLFALMRMINKLSVAPPSQCLFLSLHLIYD